MQIIINISVTVLMGAQPHNQFKIVPSSPSECLENQKNQFFRFICFILFISFFGRI